MLTGKPCTSASDIYSLGVVLWELAVRDKPSRGRLSRPKPEECPALIADLISQVAPAPAASPGSLLLCDFGLPVRYHNTRVAAEHVKWCTVSPQQTGLPRLSLHHIYAARYCRFPL